MTLAWTAESATAIERLRQRYPTSRAALMGTLWIAQRQFGHISSEAAQLVADTLGVPVVQVRELSSFYVLYHERPVGKHVIWMCRNLSCSLRGFPEIKAHLEKRLGIAEGETTPDGQFTLLANECLGACGGAPMMQVDDKFYEDLTPEGVDRILDDIRSGRS